MSDIDEIKLKSPVEHLHEFASQLTTKVRELDKMERDYTIMPQQSAEILTQMIEAHLYAVLKTMIANKKIRPEDRDAAADALFKLMKADML